MLKDKTGRGYWNVIADPLIREGCDLWLARVLAWYGHTGGVDVQTIDGLLLLDASTAEYVAKDFTDRANRYKPGTRPFLERQLADHVPASATPRERALAIMRLVRDARDHGLKGTVKFTGGTEEELMKRGADLCNEVARLFACLCQIAGFPARFVSHPISDHATSEVLVDGRWWWMDTEMGLAPVDDRDRPLSAWEIAQDPTIFERQPLSMWADCRAAGPFSTDGRDELQRTYFTCKYRDLHFGRREALAVGNYYVWNHAQYTYPWRNAAADPAYLAHCRRAEALNRKALGWPDYAFNHLLLAESFKHR